MNIPYVMKKCSKCGRWLVASTVNFHRVDHGKYGLRGQCKECGNKKSKQYYEANKEEIAKRHKRWYENNKDKIAKHKKQYQKQYYEANKEKVLERNKQYREANRDKKVEYDKQYYKNNKDKVAKQHKQYRENNRDKIAERNKQWRKANKEEIAEYHKQYYENNKERIVEQRKQYYQTPQGQIVSFNSSQKRRIKEEQQGAGITKDQWLEMMQYFDWKCAYSGEILTKDTRSVDHIVPLNSNGDNAIWNMVPMTRSLNSSKHTNNMEEWYKEQDCYDPKRLAKIYEWQEYAYNKWGKDTRYFNSGDIQIKLI